MKDFIKIALLSAILVAMATGFLTLQKQILKVHNGSSLLGYGSVSEASYSTTTSSSWNTAAATTGGFKLLKTGSGMLDSVIITNESAGSFTLYDATTTVNGAVYGTTTLAKVYASMAEDSYHYGTWFNYGLIVEFQSSNVASSTITWK